MRFLEGGPSIPDDLLVARDEGRVIFFCGAGISRARARLPDFFELAEQVLNGLGAPADSPARKLVAAARTMEPIAGITGVISADRVFSLLEREFSIKDIVKEVARALEPAPGVDLSAHKMLLDLSRGPDRKTRIVTTNFDLLFEAAGRSLAIWQPPRLPDPARHADFDGIVHLHGRVDSSYQQAVGDGLVLSSAEFGRAYLSDGWATRFIQAVTANYLIVFLGYSADDPPVQYLLEALHRTAAHQNRLFAFQDGSQNEADSRWRHKGVQAIAYESGDRHGALWKTLEAWAKRARDPARWAKALIRRAGRGPEPLLPHERGQVVHLVMNRDGAHKFASAPQPPPATWLCVFDPDCRYQTPGRLNLLGADATFFDPFDAYGLDSDPTPQRVNPSDRFKRRETPEDVEDVFALTSLDRDDLRDASYPRFRGQRALEAATISPRLGHLAAWLGKVANQPSAVWWAAGQQGLNPAVQSYVQSQLQHSHRRCPLSIRHAWEYLFEGWRVKAAREALNNYTLQQVIAVNGWNALAEHRYGELYRSYPIAKRPYWTGPKPPKNSRNPRLQDLISLEIEFPHLDLPIKVPDERLAAVLIELRYGLWQATTFAKDGLNGLAPSDLPPIEPDPDLTGLAPSRDDGISGAVNSYLTLFRRLLEANPNAAKIEAESWLNQNDPVFVRLTIWACGDRRLLADERVGHILAGLDDDGFWGSRHQRDLSLTLEKRWSALPVSARKKLETRLLKGPRRWPKANWIEFERYRANAILDRLYWLHEHQCIFTFNLETVAAPLKAKADNWRPEFAATAAASHEPRGGYVRTDKTYSDLLSIPLGSILSTSTQGLDRIIMLTERNPFAGLATDRPIRALAAITRTVDGQQYVPWGWKTLLSFDARQHDKPKLAFLFVHRLLEVPKSVLTEIVATVCSWLEQSRKVLFEIDPNGCLLLWDRLLDILEAAEPALRASGPRGRHRDWVMEAINSSAGKLAETLMADPSLNGLERGAGFPTTFTSRIERLLRLGDVARQHSLVVLAFRLNWFFAIASDWTSQNLLKALDGASDDRDALMSGFLRNPGFASRVFYERMLRTDIEYALSSTEPAGSEQTAAADTLLGGWITVDSGSGERWLSSEVLRDILARATERVRTRALWQVGRWPAAADKVTFLTEAWPKQTAAKGRVVTQRLCDIALHDADNFPELVDAIVPLLTGPYAKDTNVPFFTPEVRNIVQRFPEKFLTMIWMALPVDAAAWPHGTNAFVDLIGEIDPALLNDARLIELKRRWNARRI